MRRNRLAAGLARADAQEAAGDPLQVRREVFSAHVERAQRDEGLLAQQRRRGAPGPLDRLRPILDRGWAELDRDLAPEPIDGGERLGDAADFVEQKLARLGVDGAQRPRERRPIREHVRRRARVHASDAHHRGRRG